MTRRQSTIFLALCCWSTLTAHLFAEENVGYDEISPLITQYCAGCHNETESNGDLALDSYESILAGGETGPALTAGSAPSSRMIQVILGTIEPKMPPDEEPAPSSTEIQRLVEWINGGARGPHGNEPTRESLRTPQLPPADGARPITAIAYSPNEAILAVAQFGRIRLLEATAAHPAALEGSIISELTGLPGKITALHFTSDSKYLVAATGVAGLYGEARLWRVADRKQIRQFRGHRDLVYALDLSQDGRWLVTAGYDRKAILWDLDTGESLVQFAGHHGAIFDVALDRTASVLATASGDGSIKVWRVSDGQRLDTRSEPLKEQYTTAISPRGDSIVAAGADHRIRKWRLVSKTQPQINPLEVAWFAHETPIQFVRFSLDGATLVSVATSGEIKLWDSTTFRELHRLEDQPASVQAIDVTRQNLAVGRMDGTLAVYNFPAKMRSGDREAVQQIVSAETVATGTQPVSELSEAEPNDDVESAPLVSAPFRMTGVIHSSLSTVHDVDLVRFLSLAGQTWIIEAHAGERSPIDTRVEVLDREQRPVPRVLLQAVRDSYFTFRGKDSFQTNDFRIHHWEEMQLNQYLYCQGEVVKLYHYPRGPDSGFNVFPNTGSRHGFFDTTAMAHALHEPCYIVQPHPPGTVLKANGLPTFLLYYENDDDSQRELGSDSRLTFTAPASGEYVVRVRDVRGFVGENYGYRLTVRHPQPGFTIRKIDGDNPTVSPRSGKRIGIEIDRIDGFEGEVRIEFNDLPKGFTVGGPLAIESEQLLAWTALYAPAASEVTTTNVSHSAADETDGEAPEVEQAPKMDAGESRQASVSAIATIDGREIRQSHPLGKITLAKESPLLVQLEPRVDTANETMPVIRTIPGTTTTARVRIERRGHTGRVNFGKEDALRNAPFGVYVDNTGLNGVLIPENENERTFLIAVEPWVKPTERVVFVEAEEAGRPVSNPVLLQIVPR